MLNGLSGHKQKRLKDVRGLGSIEMAASRRIRCCYRMLCIEDRCVTDDRGYTILLAFGHA